MSKQTAQRRTVHYDTYADLVSDAETLAGQEVTTAGTWSFGQILSHIAFAINSSIDGAGFSLPAPARWLLTLLMKKRFLTKPIPSGFKAPPAAIPAETTVEEGLAALRRAIARQSEESSRAPHPGFGKISAREWTEFNLRHAELHMSHVIPNNT